MEQAYEIVCRAADADWLKHRGLGIGASEAAVLIGESPWKSVLQLYAEKIGAVDPPDLSDVEAVFWGTRLESLVLDVYRERTKRFTDQGGLLLRSIEYPWALCTLDGWTSDAELGPYWPLEIKTTGAARGGDWAEGPPEHYRIQITWQMLVTGARKATIACLIGGQKFVWCDVERDEQLVRKLIRHGEEFWRRVEQREPPSPDGTESARKTLHALYPRDDGETVVLPGELMLVADELEEIKAAEKALGVRKVQAENAIKVALGAAQRGVLGDGREFSWKYEKTRGYTVAEGQRRVLRAHQAKTSRA